jgi:hypothetical protein
MSEIAKELNKHLKFLKASKDECNCPYCKRQLHLFLGTKPPKPLNPYPCKDDKHKWKKLKLQTFPDTTERHCQNCGTIEYTLGKEKHTCHIMDEKGNIPACILTKDLKKRR